MSAKTRRTRPFPLFNQKLCLITIESSKERCYQQKGSVIEMIQSMFSIPEPKPLADLLSLEGKTAIVTGGGRGLGKYVVRRFAEAGANVVFCARHADQVQAVAEEYAGFPGTLEPLAADISIASDRQRLVDAAVEKFGGIDILVNCAAIYPPGGSLSVTEETWDSMHDIDTKAAFFLSTAVAEKMIEQGRGGRIVNFLSTAFVNAAPMFSAYAIAKAGVWKMTQIMSKEFAPYGITVNAVSPGATLTEEKAAALASGNFVEAAKSFGMSVEGDMNEMLQKVQAVGGPGELLKNAIPMGRMGYPDDLACAVLYLASDMAAYVTGQNIVVSGAQADNSTVMPPSAGKVETKPETTKAPAAKADSSPSADPDPELQGLWKVQVDTPMGRQDVEIDAKVEGNVLTGTMLFMGKKLDIQDGVASKEGFSYGIHVKVMMRKMDATVSGTRDGDTLAGTVNNPIGSFAFTATRA